MTTSENENVLLTLVEPVHEHLVPILEETLNTCAERHALGKGRGADSFSFGTDAWSFPAHVFKERANEGTIPFEVINDNGCVLVYGDLRIRHHRVGETEHDDIGVSFPRNAKAACQETSHQISLPFPPDFMEQHQKKPGGVALVLAYMANPIDGLCAVYLATVGRVSNERIREWDQTIEVWRRNKGTLSTFDIMPEVPAETVKAPVVRRVPKKVKKHGQR